MIPFRDTDVLSNNPVYWGILLALCNKVTPPAIQSWPAICNTQCSVKCPLVHSLVLIEPKGGVPTSIGPYCPRRTCIATQAAHAHVRECHYAVICTIIRIVGRCSP